MKVNPYETKRYLDEYLLFHYGQPADLCPFRFVPRAWLRFQTRIRQECLLPMTSPGPTRALDLGCAVGGLSFELSRAVDHVLGIDTSHSFIRAARRLAQGKALTVAVKESGAQRTIREVALSKGLRGGAVEFRVGSALELSAFPERAYHLVSAINLLDRLPSPRKLLAALPRLLPPGGQLILGSPFTWLEEFTSRREWLSLAQLERLLAPSFRLVRRRDIPFLIREHRRKYQLGISNVLTFLRRS